MKLTSPALLSFLLVPVLTATTSLAQEFEYGDPGIRSMSVLTFGPDGVLFIGDSTGGAVYAMDFDPGEPDKARSIDVVDVETKLAARLGTTANEVMVHDMAVHPVNGRLYLSVSRGRSGWETRWQLPNDVTDARVLLSIDAAGEIEEVDLAEAGFAHVALPNPVAEGKAHSWKQGVELRSDTITDMALVDGTLFVTGLSNEEFASTLWRIPYPFEGSGVAATTLEIFHGAHGAYETFAPIRTFVPYELGGESHVLAAYLCTPLVTFPVKDLQAGAHARGRTLAELGSGNYPLDMVVYKNRGKERLLIANSNLPFMIVKPEDIEAFEGSITKRPASYAAGVPYEPRSGTGIQQLAVLSDQFLVALQRLPGGTLDLVTFPTTRF